jgi:Tfp pilus assembly protein PilO
MSLSSGLPRLAGLEFATLCRNAANWPLPAKALLGCALVGLVWAAGDTFYLSASRQALHQQQGREAALQQQVAHKAGLAASLEGHARELQVMQDDFVKLLQQLPGETEVPGLLEDITRLGTLNGLAFEEIRLLDEHVQPLYIELPMQLGVTGSYHDLTMFIGALAGLPRIVTVHDVALSPVDSHVRLKLLAKTYRYNTQDGTVSPIPIDGMPQPAAYDSVSLRDPFQAPSRQVERPPGRPAPGPDFGRPKGFLEGFPVEQFEMVGTLSRGHQVFALLRGAAAVHRLAVGDYLGPDHGRVTAIHDSHIELVELFPDGQGAWLERSRTLALNVHS